MTLPPWRDLSNAPRTRGALATSDGGRQAADPIALRHNIKQALSIGLLRIGQNVGCGSVLNHLATRQYRDAVGNLGHHAEINGDEPNRSAALTIWLSDEVQSPYNRQRNRKIRPLPDRKMALKWEYGGQ
jgi:hypothetical protein